jgi:membrane protein required for colicin V production
MIHDIILSLHFRNSFFIDKENTMALNWVDYALLAVFFISIVGGLVRGGVREVISLCTWIAAFFIASTFAKPLANAFSAGNDAQSTLSSVPHISYFALGVSFAVLFFATIIVGTIFGYLATRVVEGGGISFFNRLLGGVFGFARGYLVNLLIVFLVQLTAFAERPIWTQSSLVHSFQPTVKWLGDKVQPGFESLKSRVGESIEGVSSGVENSVMGIYQKTKSQ